MARKRRNSAEEAKAERAQEIRDYAMLLYSPVDAATCMDMSVDQFNHLMAEPAYRDAWLNGRMKVRDSLYASLLRAAKGVDEQNKPVEKGPNVAAIRLALQMSERNPSPPSSPNDDDDDTQIADSFADAFATAMRKGHRA